MRRHRRFCAGFAGLSLGNGMLALGFLLDQTLLGPFSKLALAGTAIGAFAATVILSVAYTSPEEFDFSGSWLERHSPTVALVSGLAVSVAGVLNLGRVLVG